MTLTGKQSAIALLLIQSAIALSVAGKYAFDRATKPRIWVRTQQVDPSTPLRGRYLALRLTVDGCALATSGVPSTDSRSLLEGYEGMPSRRMIGDWPVTLAAENGQLTVHADTTLSPDNTQKVSLWSGEDCHAAHLQAPVDYFLSEHAASPLTTSRNAALWVEVTVPATGPPRPIQLATSDATGWHILKQ